MLTQNTNKKYKQKIFIALVVILLVVAGFALYISRKNPSNAQPTPPVADQINYNPPTDEEAKAGDTAKDKIIQEEQKTDTTLDSVSVIITDAAQYDDVVEIRAFMPDSYEDGTCRIILTKGKLSVIKETPAYKDATTTICTNPLIKSSEFETGEWEVKVEYTAPGATGMSQSQKITIKQKL